MDQSKLHTFYVCFKGKLFFSDNLLIEAIIIIMVVTYNSANF